MSDQNFVLSDQDGVLVGHTVLSREKKLFTALPYSLMFGQVLKRQEMMIRQVQGIGDWNLLKFKLKGSETFKLTLPSRFGRNSTVGKLILKYLEIDF